MISFYIYVQDESVVKIFPGTAANAIYSQKFTKSRKNQKLKREFLNKSRLQGFGADSLKSSFFSSILISLVYRQKRKPGRKKLSCVVSLASLTLTPVLLTEISLSKGRITTGNSPDGRWSLFCSRMGWGGG
jgi:hypothetical protein